jgi:hypothetical protein
VPSAAAIISKLDKALAKYNITDRVVYKRLFSREGGDPLIGRPGSVTATDTKLSPQPAVLPPTGNHPLLLNASNVLRIGDCILQVSPTAISKSDLENKEMMLVFKDGDKEEEFSIVSYFPTVLNGTVVLYDLWVTSRKRS